MYDKDIEFLIYFKNYVMFIKDKIFFYIDYGDFYINVRVGELFVFIF